MSDCGVQKLKIKLGLIVIQRVAYKVTTRRKHSDAVAPNQVWAGDVTYLKTGEGWM